jgi:TetR/AcrR family transcriptional regulator, transcriptional repressor of bet genes
MDHHGRRPNQRRPVPKKVDHQQRRREIAAAVGRIARERGLQGVNFREVAGEAGVSVSLVQHYFGTKENLLIGSLDIQSARLGDHIFQLVGSLGPEASPFDRLRTVIGAFLPNDDESRTAMLLYHGFAAVALTDAKLRRAEAFQNEANLRDFIAGQLQLAAETNQLAGGIEPAVEARGIVSLMLGLSLGLLLERITTADADAVLDAHLGRLTRGTGAAGTGCRRSR